MALTSAPDAKYIEQTAGHLTNLWRSAHQNWQTYDEYLHRENALWASDVDRPSYHPGRAAATIQHATDNQLAFEPRVKRFPADSEEKSKRDADRVEPFVHAVFQETALLEPVLTWKALGRHLLLYGYAVVDGPVLDSVAKPIRPKRRKGEDEDEFADRMVIWENANRSWQPFRIRAPHPATILLDPMRKRPEEGVKVELRYAKDIQRMTEQRLTKTGNAKRRDSFVVHFDVGNEPYRKVNTIEYWSLDWHALMADNKLVFSEPNTWGFVPYKHAFAGFGQQRTKDGALDVRYLATGLLEPILDSLKVQAQALSGMHNNLVEAAFPDENVIGDADSVRNQRARGERIVELRPGEQRSYMSPPEMTRWMFEAEKLVDFDIEFGTFARNLAGMRQVGTYTVGQAAIQEQSAERRFIAPALQLEHMATLVGQDILRLVDLLDEKLTVRGHEIRPTDLNHDYTLEVKFEITDPAIELQRRQVAMNEVKAGLKSKEAYWTESRVEDVTNERMRILEDKLREHPAVEAAFIEEMARLFGLVPLLEKLQEQRAAGQESAAPGPATGSGTQQQFPQPLTGQTPGVRQTGQSLAGSVDGGGVL